MALTNTNILLNFAHGSEAKLPTDYSQGTIYITTDSKRMYVDLPGQKDRLCLGNFELVTSLTKEGAPNIARATGETNTFYVTKDDKNNYALWCHDGTDFKKIVNTSELNAAISALGTRVGALETWKGEFETSVDSTYVKKAGDTMTGTLTMSNNGIVTGLPATAAGDTDATSKKYVDTQVATRAPIDHANSAATYGVGNSSKYGHVKLSDATNSASGASAGIAATPAAVKEAYDLANSAKTAVDKIDFSPYVKHDGTVAMTGDLNLGGKKITNLATPTAATDAATRGYIDGIIGGNTTNGTITKRIYDLEEALGEIGTDRADPSGTAFERIFDLSERLDDLSTAADTFINTTAPATYLQLDGSNSPMSGELKMGSNKITGLANGSAESDAATVKNVTSAVAGHADDTANASTLGHVKLSDAVDSTSGVSGGFAATPAAVKSAYSLASSAKSVADAAKATADAALPATQLPGELAKYMPLQGGTFSGAVDFAKGIALSVNEPTADKHATSKQYVDGKIDTVNTAIDTLQKGIDNLSNIMNFLGKTETAITDGETTSINKPSAVTDTTYTAQPGDVVIDKNGKECVYDGTVWRVIGDTSANSAAIKDLQDTVGSKPTAEGTPEMDDKLWDEVTDLRAELGEKNHAANASGSAFARIAYLADKYSNLDTEMDGVVAQLVWKTFE